MSGQRSGTMGVRIDHVNLVVADVERSARFYGEVLGLRRGFEALLEGDWVERVTGLPGARARCVFLESEGGGPRIELLQYLAPEGESFPAAERPHTFGVRHVAFLLESAEALEALVGRLRACGARVVSDPVTVPFPVGRLGRKRLCYFYDPDGVLLEAAAYEAGATPAD